MTSNVKILIASHKNAEFPKNEMFLPIHVGKAISNLNLPIQGDNTGDNISKKNLFYCELTAVYWAWKNLDTTEYIGLCHYRRYFTFKKLSLKQNLKNYILKNCHILFNIYNPYKRWSINNTITVSLGDLNSNIDKFSKEVEKYIKNKSIDIFMMTPTHHLNRTIEEHFLVIGRYYLNQLKEIVARDFAPFSETLDKTLSSSSLSYSNMHIMKREIFNEYCDFLFGVLTKHEYLNSNEGKSYNRVLGYIGEILTSVFIGKKISDEKIKVKEMNYLIIKEYI